MYPAALDSQEKPCWELVFAVVKAEKRVNDSWDKIEFAPPFAAMLSSYCSIAISRYNTETVALLRESFERWTREIRTGRCPPRSDLYGPGTLRRYHLLPGGGQVREPGGS